MATTTEQRAKFKELRLSGVPREQAQTQAYGSIAPNAPVAGVAPAVTPTEPTPVNVNEQQRIDNQTKRQEMIANGQVPAVGQQKVSSIPLTPTQGVTSNNQGAVGGIDYNEKETTAGGGARFKNIAGFNDKGEAIDKNGNIVGTLGLDGKIISNQTKLATSSKQIQEPVTPTATPNEEIKAKNEAQMALNKQQADLRDQERQKIAQETAQANTPKSASEMYNLIASKSPIADELKTTSSYKVAQNRYQRASKYLTMTPTQLSSEIKGAKLIEGSDTWNDLSAMNPKLVQDATNLRNVNGNKTNIWTYVNNPDGTRVKENSLENQFTNDYLDDYGAFLKSVYTPQTQAEVTAAIYTQDVKDAQNKATSYETELNSIEKDMDTIEKDVEKELTGTGATGSRSRLEKMARKEALQTEYNSVLKSYTTYANKANNLITQNTSAYEKAYTQKQALNTALASAGSLKYQNQLTLQNNQAEFDQKIAQQAQAMNDPTTAISTMIEEYKKLGIPFTRSTQQIIQDFESSGQDLGTYLTELQKLVQEKPEYQAMQARKEGEGVSYQTFGDSVYRVNADGSLTKTDIDPKSTPVATQDWSKLDDTTLFNQRTGELKKVSPAEASAYGPSSADVSPEAIKAISNRLSGDNVQCGMVSNDWMAQKFPGAKRMGDSYESKVASVESIGVSDVPQVGGVFAMNTYNSNGHTGIVQSVDLANGTFTATDANKAGKASGGPVTTSTYKISDNFTFSKGPSGVGQARPADIEYFNSATATDKKKLQSNPQYQSFQESKNTVMVDPNADIYDVMKYSQGGKDMGEERLKSLGKFSQGLSQVAELSKKIQETETGPIIGRLRSYNPYDANAQALIAEINSVVPNIARGVYGEVGVLTDADIQNYAKTLPNIKSTEDTNKLVLAMTLKTMLNGFKGQIQIDGSAGRDVSGFAGTVKQYEDRINQLLSQIGGNTTSTTPQNTDPDFDALYNSL